MAKTRILAVSDTHRMTSRLTACAEYLRCLKPDIVAHLGDHARDGDVLREIFPHCPCYAVRGNCDLMSNAPEEEIVEADGVSIYLCHGHRWDVKSGLSELRRAAQNYKCDVALFGHTHIPLIEQGTPMLVNPGAISGAEAYLALITIENGKASAALLRCP